MASVFLGTGASEIACSFFILGASMGAFIALPNRIVSRNMSCRDICDSGSGTITPPSKFGENSKMLLIDRGDACVKQDAIYAFATNGELRVKHMQLKIDGSVVVKSDNQQYEAETLAPDQAVLLRIIGRVVWSGRRM